MSLQLAINTALSGLNVNQTALSVVAQNIANVNTEGYTRKTLDQSAIYIGREQVGSGVRIDDIVRKVDKYLDRSTKTQLSASAETDSIKTYMERLQVLLGRPGDLNTIDEYMKTFLNNLQKLADTPERVAFREAAVDSGMIVAREVSGLAFAMEDLRYQAEKDIEENVNRLNTLLVDLDKVNVAIVNAGVLGNPISGLQDEQDKIIQKIADIVDIDVLVQDSHEVYIYTGNGVALLDEAAYELDYESFAAMEQLIDGEAAKPIFVYRLNSKGERVEPAEILVTGGVRDEVKTDVESGKLAALLDIRDDLMPAMLDQLDVMAAQLRDVFNAIHNNGSSYPGTNELHGTRLVSATDKSDWAGNVRIGVLDKNGEPIPSPYEHEDFTGIRPLNLDLTFLDSGTGAGQPNVQTIIDEINNHFNPPTTKVRLGNLTNIQLSSVTDRLPNTDATFEFDFDLENISGLDSEFFVRGVQAFDALGAPLANPVTNDAPSIAITDIETFAGSTSALITAANHGLSQGDRIFIADPAATPPITGSFGRFFTVTSVTTNTFEVDLGVDLGNSNNAVTVNGLPAYDTIEAGEKRRTRDSGTFTADLTGSTGSEYYDIQVTVAVFDEEALTDSQGSEAVITYRIYNNQRNLMNDRYDHTAVSGSGARFVPTSNEPFLKAILVDENGVEIQKVNGDYIDQQGYLKLVTSNPDYTVAIDELDSSQLGIVSTTPRDVGTNRGFSHYFELNNFFVSNEPTKTGDTLKNSALNLDVEERLKEDANLISLGRMEQSNAPANPASPPLYTFERRKGANMAIQELGNLSSKVIQFDAAGGLPTSRQTIGGYIGSVMAFAGSKAVASDLAAKDNQLLLQGFLERQDAVRGVNVDEELANMIVFQNAYNASARVIQTANRMFDALFEAI